MNLPNILTIIRFLLVGVFIYFMKQSSTLSYLIAAAFFVLAAITDYFDGYFARKYGLFSDFGKIMDPIADKFLILSAFFIFMQMHLIAAWMFYLVAGREILVTVSRLSLMRKGKVIAAERAGKWKTVLQMAAVFLTLGSLIVGAMPYGTIWLQEQGTMFWWFCISQMVMLLAVFLTLYSGMKYFWNNRKDLC